MNLSELGESLDKRDRPLMDRVEELYGTEVLVQVLEVANCYLEDEVDPELLGERLEKLPADVRQTVRGVLPEHHEVDPPKNRGHKEALRYAMEASRGFFEVRRAVLEALLGA